MTLIHPFTGEMLDPNALRALELVEADLDAYLRGFSPLYGIRRELRERIAELRGPAILPRRRDQTQIQQRVDECPRCGERHPRKREATSSDR